MTVKSRPYQGESAEKRKRARQQQLIDAACTLLANNGWRQITIDKLCQEAKLNKRYFYESFASIDDLAAEVIQQLFDELFKVAFDAAQSALSQKSKKTKSTISNELAESTIREVLTYLTEDSRRSQVLFSDIANNPKAVSIRKKAVKDLAKAISAFGHEYHEADSFVPVAELAAALVLGGSIEVIKQWLDGSIKLSFDEVVAELAAMWVLVGDGTVKRVKN